MADTVYDNNLEPLPAPENLPENKQKRKSANQRKTGKFFTKDLVMCIIILVAIAVVSGSLLGVLNWVTYVDPEAAIMELVAKHYEIDAGQIIRSEDRVINAGGKNKVERCFTATDADGNVLGIAYHAIGSGAYKGTLEIIVYISNEGIIQDLFVFKHNETPNKLKDVIKEDGGNLPKYRGLDVTKIDLIDFNKDNPIDVDAIGGATFTSKALNNAVNAVIYAFNNYEGGAIDE